MTISASGRYASRAFLEEHVRSILGFYHPRCLDGEVGGYINAFRDDGSVFDRDTKHLVGTCRFIYNFSLGYVIFGAEAYRQAAAHGVAFLLDGHLDWTRGGFAWVLDRRRVRDATRHCYGHAFALLALAGAHKAGVPGADHALRHAWEIIETRFWASADDLCIDEISADWQTVADYRGQNANMHLCEALIAAFEATGERPYLDRAATLARRIVGDLASMTGGLVWEHYTPGWTIDRDYNRDDPKNLFRPYGYLPGHWAEWTKLLLLLDRHAPDPWLVDRARFLLDAALTNGWDADHGGLVYTLAPDDMRVLDADKYHWVMAEAIAASALLAQRLELAVYWDWYERLWRWSEAHLIDRQRGGWWRLVDREGRKYDDLKSPPAKADYHPLSACYEVWRVLHTAPGPAKNQ